MSYEFMVDRLPYGYTFHFENYLFNKIVHINSQGIENRMDLFVANHEKKRIEAKVHFLLQSHTAFSPFKSLFGSFELNHRLATNLFTDFVRYMESQLGDRGVRTIRIAHHASAYMPLKSEKVKNVLVGCGFKIAWTGTNHHIPVLDQELQPRMHDMEKRRLRKCVRMGLQFVQEPASSAEEVYAFIAACRKEQALQPSITLSTLRFYLERFPVHYKLFAVRDPQHRLYAATVAIRVCRRILYNFLPASPGRYRNLSPAVLLHKGLYDYCRVSGHEILDLGVSTTPDGRDQESLITFKQHMGAVPSAKWRFEKER